MRFLSEEKNRGMSAKLTSQFLGHIRANGHLSNFMTGLSYLQHSKNLLQILMDGPPTN